MLNSISDFLGLMPVPIWIKDREGIYVYANKAYYQLHHVRKQEVIGSKVEHFLPEQIAEVLHNNCLDAMRLGEPQVYEAPVGERWKQCIIVPLIEDGICKGCGGMVLDIDDAKKQALNLAVGKDVLHTIIDAIPSTIFYKDWEGRYIFCNKACLEDYNVLGIHDIVGKTDLEINPDKELALKFRQADQEIMASKMTQYTSTTFPREDGVGYREVVKVPVIGKNEEVWGVVGVSTDITAKKRMEDSVRYLRSIDPLTRVYNRYTFEEKIKELNQEENYPLGIILGDVNGLKLVNDTVGHLEGDKLLKCIADVIRSVSEEGEEVFRWGGDEFVILIPRTNEAYCERFIRRIQEQCKVKEASVIKLSISLGMSIKTDKKQTFDECFKEAEAKVYRQKLLEDKSINSAMVYSLKNTLEAKDVETKEHTERIVGYVKQLSELLGLPCDQVSELILATQFHDIGKIGIGEEILQKTGPLTDEEYAIMKTHTEKGFRILQDSPQMQRVARSVLTHHERWDGKGYPLGLKGEEIPLYARIIAVVDAYDAMVNNRIYRKAIGKEEAMSELIKGAGTQFDPAIVECFLLQLTPDQKEL